MARFHILYRSARLPIWTALSAALAVTGATSLRKRKCEIKYKVIEMRKHKLVREDEETTRADRVWRLLSTFAGLRLLEKGSSGLTLYFFVYFVPVPELQG